MKDPPRQPGRLVGVDADGGDGSKFNNHNNVSTTGFHVKTKRREYGYEGKVGHARFEFERIGERWTVCCPQQGWVARPRKALATLKEAKAAATKYWIRLALNSLCRLVKSQAGRGRRKEFYALYDAAWKFTDPVAPLALRDWLVEQGFERQLDAWLIEPGRKAKVTFPAGWGLVANG